eukprot:530179-Hanusia_phi.AAC.2
MAMAMVMIVKKQDQMLMTMMVLVLMEFEMEMPRAFGARRGYFLNVLLGIREGKKLAGGAILQRGSGSSELHPSAYHL